MASQTPRLPLSNVSFHRQITGAEGCFIGQAKGRFY
jgi:hypothetical protein